MRTFLKILGAFVALVIAGIVLLVGIDSLDANKDWNEQKEKKDALLAKRAMKGDFLVAHLTSERQ